jgi:hypothetical protein
MNLLTRLALPPALLIAAASATADAQPLQTQESISCDFRHGTTDESFTLVIDEIDAAGGRAAVSDRTHALKDPAVVVTSPTALTFIEQPQSGPPSLTTVFYSGPPWLAVRSRHSRGQAYREAAPAQFYGACSPHISPDTRP